MHCASVCSGENRRDVDDAGCVEPLHDRRIGQQATHGGGRAGRNGSHDVAVVVHRLISNHLTGPQPSESIVTDAKGSPQAVCVQHGELRCQLRRRPGADAVSRS